jgi:hypothetical protein
MVGAADRLRRPGRAAIDVAAASGTPTARGRRLTAVPQCLMNEPDGSAAASCSDGAGVPGGASQGQSPARGVPDAGRAATRLDTHVQGEKRTDGDGEDGAAGALVPAGRR